MHKNNQRYAFYPYPTDTELRLLIVTQGALTLDEAHRMTSDLLDALVDLARLAACDGLEIDPCIGLDGNGTTTDYMTASNMERMPASDAAYAPDVACWTVYGHLRDGGSIALLDFPSRADAESAAALLTPFVGTAVLG